MLELLTYLARHLLFLFEENWFRIVDTATGHRFATLTLESKATRLKLVLEDLFLSADLQPKMSDPKSMAHWHNIAFARSVLQGKDHESGQLDASAAAFLAAHLPRIDEEFANETKRGAFCVALETARQARAEDWMARYTKEP